MSIARSSFYYAGTGESPLTLRLRRLIIDEQFLETPFYGSRQMTRWLRRQGDMVSRKRGRRLMRLLGVHALYQRPRTSQPHPAHRIYHGVAIVGDTVFHGQHRFSELGGHPDQTGHPHPEECAGAAGREGGGDARDVAGADGRRQGRHERLIVGNIPRTACLVADDQRES